jgi:predicted  nucleic acid-binding Zn-ribbon protein
MVNYLFSTKEGFRKRFRVKRIGKDITKTANVAGDGLSNNELTKNMDSMGKDIAGLATKVASIQKKIKEAEKEAEKEVEAADKVKEINENKEDIAEDIAEEYDMNDNNDDLF